MNLPALQSELMRVLEVSLSVIPGSSHRSLRERMLKYIHFGPRHDQLETKGLRYN